MSYQRNKETQRRLKKLYDNTKNKYCLSSASYNEDKGYYYRYYCTTSYKKYLKKLANKKVRRYLKNTDILISNCEYKKLSDYWWMLY